MRMSTMTRKRKLSTAVDTDSCPSEKELMMEDASPVKRRSPRKPQQSPTRKKLLSSMDQKACPSPQKKAAAGSPTKSLLKPSMMTSSFYGKQKPGYLTPLERKALKESLPAPPPPPIPALSKTTEKKKKKKKNAKTGSKPRKATGSSKGGKSSSASTKRIKPSPGSSSVAASSRPTAITEPKKSITVSFSSVKPKPKIFVGAAFFSTAKKPTSMYKKTTPRVSSRTAGAPRKNKAQLVPDKTAKTNIQSVQRENEPEAKRIITKFDPSDWLDCENEELEFPLPLSSPKILSEKFGIKQDVKIILSRTPSPRPASVASSLSVQDECLTDISPIESSPNSPKESPAVYPIFGSASKRIKKAALKPPLSCSTPSGGMVSLQRPCAAPKERRVRSRKEKQDNDQLIIDAGQKQFGATTCSSCGMIYSADNPEDNFQHTQFHQRFLDSIKYVGWKKERVVAEFWDGKILLVMPDDPKYTVKKAEDVRRVADSELGFQQLTLSQPKQARTYLFVNTERMVVGCLVAEPIRQAFRVLEKPNVYKDMTKDDFMEPHRAWCCSTAPEPALCGISRIWVFSLARRKGVASRMLDTVRSSFTYGSHLTKKEIAFSDPTPDGKLFATKYCSTPAFLVYNFVA
ncbi:N-acetyltransferase ESCO2 [Gouania willdenowi]|uniref:N-acetyltransferase ESCO2 n=1 Tax=Gouania willdenowi TaxID=441366 RepID=A0A8C5I674_GOUWI|nr:N-acetyltransferase ESCO2 [Gouania willdenowi]